VVLLSNELYPTVTRSLPIVLFRSDCLPIEVFLVPDEFNLKDKEPTAVFKLPVLQQSADSPIAVFPLPLPFDRSALDPTAVLVLPAVFEQRLETPNAVLSQPVVLLRSAWPPIATFSFPVVLQ
jgi:hypothetical protein